MVEDTNGWPEYKKTVIQQLEYLTREVKEVREAVNQVDKDIASMVTRDKLEADIAILNVKRETDMMALNTKRELDLTSISKRRDEHQILVATRLNEIIADIKAFEIEFAAHKGEEEKGRRMWGIIITAITITINIAALITALVFIK